jgi:hypothetical protein
VLPLRTRALFLVIFTQASMIDVSVWHDSQKTAPCFVCYRVLFVERITVKISASSTLKKKAPNIIQTLVSNYKQGKITC